MKQGVMRGIFPNITWRVRTSIAGQLSERLDQATDAMTSFPLDQENIPGLTTQPHHRPAFLDQYPHSTLLLSFCRWPCHKEQNDPGHGNQKYAERHQSQKAIAQIFIFNTTFAFELKSQV